MPGIRGQWVEFWRQVRGPTIRVDAIDNKQFLARLAQWVVLTHAHCLSKDLPNR